MIKEMLCILLLIHILGDFYFQSQKMADYKKEKIVWVLRHSALYAIVTLILVWLIVPGFPIKYTACFIAGHAIIDTGKYFVCKSKTGRKNRLLKQEQNLFVIDQLLHVLMILGIVYGIRNVEMDTLYNVQYVKVLEVFEISGTVLLSWLIKILLIHKPANIFISGILSKYKPAMKEPEETADKNIGRYIGTLERIVMVILMSIEQYSAVGLVLTAKSIARYDRISKEQEFAEYYLLGTLLSTICAITVSLVF